MSIVYLIAFDNKLKKTEYLYQDIFSLKVFSNEDGILFDKNLTNLEDEISKKVFQQRHVYSIKCTVPLCFKETDKVAICSEYYNCEKKQLIWLKNFIKDNLSETSDILFYKVALGHSINYTKIKTKKIKIDKLNVEVKNFDFDNEIYQFVL